MIRARYDGSCMKCGAAYQIGHRIGWTQSTGTTLCLPCTLPAGVSPEKHGASGIHYPELGPVIILDFETTGVNATRDRVVEVALVTTDETLRPVEVWTTLVDPEGPVGATHIHGITPADVQGAPRFAELVPEILHRVTAGKVLVAHNLPFDLGFLRAEVERAGHHLPPLPAMCTLQTARRQLPAEQSHSLENLGRNLGLLDPDEEQEHAAASDALLTARLLEHLVARARRERRSHQVALTAGKVGELPERSDVRLHPRGTPPVSEPAAEPARPEASTPDTPREAGRKRSSRRVRWEPRTVPTGWEAVTTNLGGRLPGEELDAAGRRRRSHAQVWSNLPGSEPDETTRWWVAVTQKLLQRGEAPPVPRSAAEALQALPAGTIVPRRAAGLPEGLHPTYEEPFWLHVAARNPELVRWLHPQAPLEDLAGAVPEESGRRYVDFVLAVPGTTPVVIELDGSGHVTERAVDRERDRLLAGNVRVVRVDGAAGEQLDPELDRAAEAAAEVEAVSALVDGPATWTRLSWAMTEGVRSGTLTGERWTLQVDDELGSAEHLVGSSLDLLTAVETLGGCSVMPAEVVVNGAVWTRDGQWTRTGEAESPTDLHVTLQVTVPLSDPLPETDGPHVLVRGTVLPVDLTWANRNAARRHVDDTPETREALEEILAATLGHPDFREGQAEAVLRVLGGEDLSVLLPTGSGKTLVYQLAGLLQPGGVVIVDPIVSLIQDQHRRMVEDGIDRTLPLSSQHQRSLDERQEAYRQLAAGEALYTLLAPERLQTKELRAALRTASRSYGIALAVVDEAHCVSEWGHDFRTPYLRLGQNLRRYCHDQTGRAAGILALTGTASPAVLKDVLFELEIPAASLVQPASFDRANLTYRVVRTSTGEWRAGVTRALVEDVPGHLGAPGIAQVRRGGVVFVPWTNGDFGVETLQKEVTGALTRVGANLRTAVYSGKAPRGRKEETWSETKAKVATSFTRGGIDLLVATKAFGMGIDKPDIGYTIHVGFPSSIEAFAQEAGRAGRDLQTALCTLVSTVDDDRAVRRLLDPRLTWEEFVKAAKEYEAGHSRHRSDDLARQLHFLVGSFPGRADEFVAAVEVLTELERGPRGGIVAIPRTGDDRRERALYRLALVGVVEDYTIDYGARKYEVRLHPYTAESIDEAVLEYLRRVEPSRTRRHPRTVAAAPAELDQRVRHHLELLVGKVYELVGPARRNALAGVADLARATSDDEVREKILAYLARGPLVDVLARTGDGTLTVAEGLAEIDRIPATPTEWVGAATRQLEGQPSQPLSLLLRGLGEALQTRPDREQALSHLTRAFTELRGEPGAVDVLGWALDVLHRREPARWGEAVTLWQAWDDAGMEHDTTRVEEWVLGAARRGLHHPDELVTVLTRRTRALSEVVREHADRRTGE